MTQKLDERRRAPRLVLDDKVTFSFAQWGGCQFAINGSNDNGFHLGYTSVEGVYNSDGEPLWKNHNFPESKPAEPKDNYRGLQIALSDQVVYEGANMGGNHFSFLKNGKYAGHNHQENLALDFPYGLVKAIFDRDGIYIWKNSDLRKVKA